MDGESLIKRIDALGPLDGRHVLLLRGVDAEPEEVAQLVLDHLMAVAVQRGEANPNDPPARYVPLIIQIDPGQSVELLNEEAMAAAGWFHAPALLPCPDCHAGLRPPTG